MAKLILGSFFMVNTFFELYGFTSVNLSQPNFFESDKNHIKSLFPRVLVVKGHKSTL